MLTPRQKEELRESTLGFLAARHPLAFEPAAIAAIFRRRKPELDFDYSGEDLMQASEFLVSAGMAVKKVARLGSTATFAATADGILEAERKGYA